MLDIINNYLHGYVATPVIISLVKKDVFKTLQENGPITIEEIANNIKANVGNLQVAFNMFEALGWVKNSKGYYTLALENDFYFNLKKIPFAVDELYTLSIPLILRKRNLRSKFNRWISLLLSEENIPIRNLLQGAIAVPLLLAIRLNYYKDHQLLLDKLPEDIKTSIVNFFEKQNWWDIEKNIITQSGIFMMERALNLALAASYAPMLSKIDELLYGDPRRVFRKNIFGHETHIDRELNIVSSAFQHERYFSDIEEIILSIFNNEPVQDQPDYIIDTGCGDGSLLKKIYSIILTKSIRGKVIKEYPLIVIGVDVNKKALRTTEKNLKLIPHYTIYGDISNPQKLLIDLNKLGLKNLHKSLHVRSFLDHDRTYIRPKNMMAVNQRQLMNYTGAYVDEYGEKISSAELMQSLIEHLERWQKIIASYGILILEVHCLSPQTISEFFNQSESFYFDALQAFSKQYPVSAVDFLLSACEAGLFPKTGFSRRYPQMLPYTRISLHYFEKRLYKLSYATLNEVDELLKLEEDCWAAPLRVSKKEIISRILQYPEGQLVARNEKEIIAVIYTQRILDTQSLKVSNAKEISMLHNSEGSILQLIGINLKPSYQGKGIGDELLELILLLSRFMVGIKKLIGVSRCKDFIKHPEMNINEYIKMHMDDSCGIDPILRFHTSHGADIIDVIPNYRPEDNDNHGMGILVEYDINKTKKTTERFIQESDNISNIVSNCIRELIPQGFSAQYSDMLPLMEIGFDSLRLLELRVLLNQKLKIQLDPTFFFQYSSSKEIINYLKNKMCLLPLKKEVSKASITKDLPKESIAVIGIGCRFPGNVKDADDLWKLLKNGKSTVTSVPEDRWENLSVSSINKGSFLKNIDKFDADFFHISPREAELMDPQQRMLLEVAWESLENAGLSAYDLKGSKAGVFIGAFTHDYENLIEKNKKPEDLDAYFGTGISESILAGRISYQFGLKGPAIVVNTACSSSLVAVHLACQSISQSECDLALAGGVNLILTPELNISFFKAGMLSADGYCKTFDETADGYVRGEGCGLIVLKKLSKAIADKDNILAIIRSSTINQDGASNGLTAPNGLSQEELLHDALEKSELTPDKVTYIEAHGTGTPLGDPIEVKAIANVYCVNRNKDNQLFLGSIKTNIGHTEGAAGIASLIKTIQSLRNHSITGNLHFHNLNHYIEANEGIYFPKELVPWRSKNNEPLRAGVSSFGFSGTNAHAIVEEWIDVKSDLKNNPYYLVTLSAMTPSALNRRMIDLLAWLNESNDKYPLQDISYTLNSGRSHFENRCAIVIEDISRLKIALEDLIKNKDAADAVTSDKYKNELINCNDTSLIKDIKYKELSKEEYQDKLLILAKFYVSGHSINWNQFYANEEHKKIVLPTYPFSQTRYWITNSTQNLIKPHLNIASLPSDNNIYKKLLTGKEFYLAEHYVGKQPMLPAVAYIEMVHEVGKDIITNDTGMMLTDISFISPLIFKGEPLSVSIEMIAKESGTKFQITSSNIEIPVTHANGWIKSIKEPKRHLVVEINEVKNRCIIKCTPEEIYSLFAEYGLKLGSSFHSIRSFNLNPNQLESLTTIQIPEHLRASKDDFILHPSLLDGILQTGLALLKNDFNQYQSLFIPFGIKQIIVYGTLSNVHYVHAERMQSTEKLAKIKITATDKDGNVLVSVEDFTLRPIAGLEESSENKAQLKYYISKWQRQELENITSDKFDNILVFDDSNQIREKLSEANVILVMQGNRFKKTTKFQYEINSKDPSDFKLLMDDLKSNNSMPKTIIYNSDFDNYEKNIFILFLLCRALAEQKFKDKLNILYLYSRGNLISKVFSYALYGFVKSLQLELPNIIFHILESREINIKLLSNEIKSKDILVKYKNNMRWIRKYREVTIDENKASPLRQNGVYLITGGAGGLGLVIASYLAKNYRANIILIGRKSYNEAQKEVVRKLNNLGADAIYLQADVASRHDMQKAFHVIKNKFAAINGIIHCAGIVKDAFFVKKSYEDLVDVFHPKISGARILDSLTQFENLDFFLLFSSITSVFGNVGQCDYSYANSFLNEFARYRNKLVKKGQRQGKSISICWPLWSSGGMKINKTSEEWLEQIFGLKLISTNQGLDAFEKLLSQNFSNPVVLFGDDKIYEKKLDLMKIDDQQSINKNIIPNDTLPLKVKNHLVEVLASLIKSDSSKINPEKSLSNYGVDSIIITAFANQLNQFYRIELTPAILFEHTNLNSLSNFLIENYISEVESKWSIKKEISHMSNELPVSQLRMTENKGTDIAIIGMSGIFPGSSDLDTYWNNLENQNDLITEIPKSRWNWEDFYGEGENKIKVKWGGFIEDIDKFDAKFFKISPNEAEVMDPQHRLFLETVWKTIEDAGYAIEDIASQKTGLFVGVATNDYSEILSRLKDITPQVSTGMLHSVLANRVSYILNLQGPSEPVDTACSSSLVAIHNAIKAIEQGDCELAIAGGVHAMITPTLFLSFSKAGMLSPDGKCKTFDKSANGYVRGEGVGAILLKRLSKAIEDGDHIYGVIKGSGVSHGGHVNSLTVPNPNAQAELIATVLDRAATRPETITYVETHGTGTALGDPVEVNGLKKGFNIAAKKNNELKALPVGYVALGSVKTNIGHLEAAAGIAGVIKILLAMRHAKLPGIVNFNELNPYIEIKNTPFYIVEKTKAWDRLKDEFGNEIPLRASISSFGFGGAYSHLVIEEPPAKIVTTEKKVGYLITLSAKSNNALYEKITQLRHWLIKDDKNTSLENISFTLNAGRTHFQYRCAVVASTVKELQDSLLSILDKKADPNSILGIAKESNEIDQQKEKELDKIIKEIDHNQFDEQSYKSKLIEVGKYFIEGYQIDWQLLHDDESKLRISLPSYPFERKRFWVSESSILKTNTTENAQLHPLIDENCSTLKDVIFSKKLTIDMFYLSDHHIKGISVLPGVVYLEMARAAGELALPEKKVIGLENIVWKYPLRVHKEEEIFINIYNNENNIGFIVSKNNNKPIYCEGNILYDSTGYKNKKILNYNLIKNRCNKQHDVKGIYQQCHKQGLQLGKKFQLLREVVSNDTESLATIQIENENVKTDYILHPALLDSALHAIFVLRDNFFNTNDLYIPYGMKKVEIYGKLPAIFYSHAKKLKEPNEYNIEIFDTEGNILVTIDRFVMRLVLNNNEKKVDNSTVNVEVSDSHILVSVQNKVLEFISSLLNMNKDEIDINKELGNYGMDSIYFTELTTKLNRYYGLELTPANLFDYSTVAHMVQYLIGNYRNDLNKIHHKEPLQNNLGKSDFKVSQDANEKDIAIVGMAGIFPGSPNLNEFWKNLVNKNKLISEIPESRWRWVDYEPKASKWGAFVDEIDKFDAEFFNISPREAELMDPQQRLFLEVVWNCIEHAGYDISDLSKTKTGLFVGVSSWDYSELLNQNNYKTSHAATGTVHSILANRVSYFLDLHGPSIAVDTACSSSLIAVHEAIKAIQLGDCNIAIAGGVNAIITPSLQIEFSHAGMISPNGECKTFDKDANGYVRGEGAGAILLKPLSKAISDNDTIYGVIKGSSVNHGGRVSSLTVPNSIAQADLIVSAIESSKLNVDEISYIETHGTGTSLGDPIEVNGLIKAFQELSQDQEKNKYCGLGSVKTNIGHLEAAAGIASVIKVLLSMQNKKLPGLLNFNTLNPYIKIENTPFYIVEDTVDWTNKLKENEKNEFTRIAGISCFGFGGANAHLIIKEYQNQNNTIDSDHSQYLITLSAKNNKALKQRAIDLEEWIADNESKYGLDEISYTLNVGRTHFKKRYAFIVDSLAALKSNLIKIKNDTISLDIKHDEVHKNNLAAEKTIDAESYKNNLEQLAKMYMDGHKIDFNNLYNNKKRIALPTYPFNKERYWISTKIAQRESFWIASRSWQKTPLITQSNNFSGKVAIVVPDGSLEFIEKIFNEFSSLEKTYFINDFSNITSDFDAIIDLSDVNNVSNEWKKVERIQYLLKEKNFKLVLLHFTKRLQDVDSDSQSLSGALMVSLIPSLGAEYINFYGKSIDIDFELNETNKLKQVINNELILTNKQAEICYRNNDRFIPEVKNILFKDSLSDCKSLQIDKNKVYFVTGGTGEIGTILVSYLISLGVTKLVISGLNEKSKNNISEILQNKKLQIEYYYGELNNKDKMTNFIKYIHDKLGQFGGVIHCAGYKPNNISPFVSKSIEEIKKVCGPKVEALQILHDIFKHDALDFFILVSSLSSVIPRLGAGICDYAMANGYMNYFSNYYFHHGFTYYRSLIWGRWNMGNNHIENNKIYSSLGFLRIEEQQGIELINKSVEIQQPVLMTAIVDPDIFNIDNLLKTKNDIQSNSEKVNISIQNSPDTWLVELFSETLKLPISKINLDKNFGDLGIDSIFIAELVKNIEKKLEKHIDPNIFIEYPTLNLLSNFLRNTSIEIKRVVQKEKLLVNEEVPLPIAIVGIACHFPLAENKDEFWNNLKNGLSSITEVPSSRWGIDNIYRTNYESGKSISKWGGFLSNIEYFDPLYFSIKEKDASQIDPLERQFLEVSAEVLADAGYTKEELSSRKVGVFVGSRIANYGDRIEEFKKHTVVGIGQNFIATHVSHFFNFKGPSLVVDTACSSSLVSLHLACKSIRDGECEMALAGGVDILLDERPYLILSEGKALSPDGKCHTFDEEANGFVPGEGAGVVLLKSLPKAIQDGDRIYAVIEGSAINNDGSTMGITTPNPEAQREVIETAYTKTKIDTNTVSYIEAHGTGTLIGDPIELKALASAFDKSPAKMQFCAIGSVKTNIGHTMSAAGIASVIKVALSLYHKELVPTLNCRNPNPRFNFENSPFYPVTNFKKWDELNGMRRAGISSFGFGGTNVHSILRGYDQDVSSITRHALPKITFNRKRYWLEKPLQSLMPKSKNNNRKAIHQDYEHFEEFFIKRILK